MGSTNHQLASRLRTVMKHYAVLDSVTAVDPSLTKHLERKNRQTEKRNDTRKKTTKTRIAGQMEDLEQAVGACSGTVDLHVVVAYTAAQEKRKASMKLEKSAVISARREARKKSSLLIETTPT